MCACPIELLRVFKCSLVKIVLYQVIIRRMANLNLCDLVCVDLFMQECIMGSNMCYAVDHDVITDECYIYTNDEDACQPLLPSAQFHHVKVAPC